MCISSICRVCFDQLYTTQINVNVDNNCYHIFIAQLQKVGCDWAVDSNTTEDQCGICGGNGETCTTIRGEFNKKMNTTDDYFEITSIPIGSRQILIEEIHQSKNFLCVDRANSTESFLNGNHVILMPGEFTIDKIMGLYERDNEQEKIKIPGPIPFDLSVKVRFINCSCATAPLDVKINSTSTIIIITHFRIGFGPWKKQKSGHSIRIHIVCKRYKGTSLLLEIGRLVCLFGNVWRWRTATVVRLLRKYNGSHCG